MIPSPSLTVRRVSAKLMLTSVREGGKEVGRKGGREGGREGGSVKTFNRFEVLPLSP